MDLNRLPEDGESDVLCSICLDPANKNVERTVVELKCKHKFHLDCIGSAFNAKMEMQCPNCRNVEVGDWQFPGGYVPVPDADEHRNNEEIVHMEMIEPNHLREMAISIHWCPFEDVAPSSTLFSEGDIASSSYTHAHVRRWSGPSGHTFEGTGWEHHSLPLATGGLNSRAEPIPLASFHPFLSPLSVGPFDQGLQQPVALPPDHPTQNLIDLLGPGAETGLNISSINLRPFFPTSTEHGHQTTRPNWQ